MRVINLTRLKCIRYSHTHKACFTRAQRECEPVVANFQPLYALAVFRIIHTMRSTDSLNTHIAAFFISLDSVIVTHTLAQYINTKQ